MVTRQKWLQKECQPAILGESPHAARTALAVGATTRATMRAETQTAVSESQCQVGVASLRPITPATISTRLTMRPALAASPSSTMPRMAVPNAPMPTHTA